MPEIHTLIISSNSVQLQDIIDGDITPISTQEDFAEFLNGIPQDSTLAAWSDSRETISSLTGLANIGLGEIERGRFMTVLAQAMHRLADSAGPSTAWTTNQADGFHLISDGPLVGAPLVGGGSSAIIASIAIPNLLESRISANESAAATSLKSGFFPAQISFQAMALVDHDQDGRGSYGFMGELSGHTEIGGQSVSLLSTQYTGPHAVISGYHFQIYVLDGKGQAFATPAERDASQDNGQERYWVAYAWPTNADNGRRRFAITHEGTIYSDFSTAAVGRTVGTALP